MANVKKGDKVFYKYHFKDENKWKFCEGTVQKVYRDPKVLPKQGKVDYKLLYAQGKFAHGTILADIKYPGYSEVYAEFLDPTQMGFDISAHTWHMASNKRARSPDPKSENKKQQNTKRRRPPPLPPADGHTNMDTDSSGDDEMTDDDGDKIHKVVYMLTDVNGDVLKLDEELVFH